MASWASGVWIDGSSGSVRLIRSASAWRRSTSGWSVGGVGAVDVGFVSGPGEGDVGAFACGVTGDDEVGGVGGVPLGWEWVLDVGEAEVGLGDLVLVERQFGAVREAEIDGARFRVDVHDLGGGAVAQLPVFVVVDGAANLDVVAWVQFVGPAGHGNALVAELSVLAADRLGAGVELVEVFV